MTRRILTDPSLVKERTGIAEVDRWLDRNMERLSDAIFKDLQYLFGLAYYQSFATPNSETVTGTATANLSIYRTDIDSSGGAVTLTVPDGTFDGQRKKIGMSDASNSSTCSVTSHETSDPEVFTFAQDTDSLILEWDTANEFWWTVKNIGAAT